MAAADTPNFGFTRVALGESFTKNGNAFSDRDRAMLDLLISALDKRPFTGEPRLGNPAAPGLAVSETGGSLPGSMRLYYKVSLIDKWGLETAGSPEVMITTGASVEATTAPLLDLAEGGTLPTNTYYYVYTYVSTRGGETIASASANITVDGTSAERSVTLSLPVMPSGASHANIYRTRKGLSDFFYVGQTAATTFVDDGLPEDCCGIVPPLESTAATTNAINISLDADDLTSGAVAWRVYRSTTSGSYDSSSLIGEAPIGTLTIIDTGTAMLSGSPRTVSSTIGSGAIRAARTGDRCITGTTPYISSLSQTTDYWQIGTPIDIEPIMFTLQIDPAHLPTGRTQEPATVYLKSSNGGEAPIQIDDNFGYFMAEWPTAGYFMNATDLWSGVDTPFFQVEDATCPLTQSAVAIPQAAQIGDSFNSGYVQLDVVDEDGNAVEMSPTTLQPGAYTAYVMVKGTVDLQLDVTVADEAVATGDVSVSTSNWTLLRVGEEWNVSVVAQGAVDFKITVTTPATGGTAYLGYVWLVADRPRLHAGRLYLRSNNYETGTIGENFTFSIWY